MKRTDSFAKGETEIVLASFAMHFDGKIPDVQVDKIEKWLRVRSKSDKRALRALPGKSSRRSTTSRFREGDRAARSRPMTSEGGGLALGERHPTTAGCRRLIGDELIGLWTHE